MEASKSTSDTIYIRTRKMFDHRWANLSKNRIYAYFVMQTMHATVSLPAKAATQSWAELHTGIMSCISAVCEHRSCMTLYLN